ncbi:MAG: TonB-dependent copper receptor [Marinobacterium sp.]|nr:TonB-dependent copper receptor [Marinobacterium sp.]
MRFRKQALVMATAMAMAATAQAESPLTLPGMVVDVTSEGLRPGGEGQLLTAIKAAPTPDAGELLRSINGVTAVRKGGRALDLLIRGQSETQLNVLLDGGYLHGGCPNRMDPPSSYASVDSYDSVTVIKGNRTVRYGGGGSGGTVLFEREWPLFEVGKPVQGEVSASYIGNGERAQLGADVAAGSERSYIRYLGHLTDSDNYEDGDGNEVRSSFESASHTLMGGMALGDNTRLEASYERTRDEDVLFPGAGMDSPYADADNYRLRLQHDFEGQTLQSMEALLYRSEVAHNMDNFSLRQVPSGSKPMEAPSTSDTDGLRLTFEARAAEIDWSFGVDLQRNQRDADKLMVMNGMRSQTAILWPDVETEQLGVFVEGYRLLGSNDQLGAGLRYDRVSAQARRAGEAVAAGSLAGQTPADLYGVSADVDDEHNIGGFVSWRHNLNSQYVLETTLSRSVRTADATERFLANPMWVGNPQLNPEKHHQLELALESSRDALQWRASVWYNDISDYILRQKQGMTTRYRNVDATLYGAEFSASWQMDERLSLTSALAWLEGENDTDNQSLDQIAPLSLTSTLDYSYGQGNAGLEWVLAGRQNDVCLSSTACGGLDTRQTPGYGVLNLYSEYRFQGGVTLAAGIDNLLDKAYSTHESVNDLFNPEPVQVAEAGRSAWLRLSAAF